MDSSHIPFMANVSNACMDWLHAVKLHRLPRTTHTLVRLTDSQTIESVTDLHEYVQGYIILCCVAEEESEYCHD